MDSIGNKLCGVFCLHLCVLQWRKWVMLWIVAILIPCGFKASFAFSAQNDAEKVGDSVIHLDVFNDAGGMIDAGIGMSNSAQLDQYGPEQDSQFFRTPKFLHFENRFNGTEAGDVAPKQSADQARAQQTCDDFDWSHLLLLIVPTTIGQLIGCFLVSRYVWYFIM